MKKITFLIVGLVLTCNVFGQKLFDNYRTLKNPLNDSSIVGKISKKGIHTGEGTSAIKEFIGLTKFTSNDSTEIKTNFEVAVSKVVSGTINLSNQKAVTSNFDDIKIIECSDFSKINLTGGKGDYVIGAIYVGSFDVKIGKEFDVSLKAELEKEIADKFNVKPDIKYNKNKAQVKLGGKLIVAEKLLRIKKNRYYIETLNIENSNKIEWNDKLTTADNSLKFESINKLNNESLPGDNVNDHLGCFNLKFVNLALPAPKSNNSLSRTIVVCPSCSEMKSDIKPDCQDYNPNPKHKNISLERIATGITNDFIVFYSVSVNNLNVLYEKKPKEGVLGDNYKIDKVKATIKVRKNVYHYRIK